MPHLTDGERPVSLPPALPVTFRPGRTRAVLLVLGCAAFGVLTAVALLLDPLGPGERATFVVTGALFLGLSVLLSRPHAVADEQGLTVVNLTTRRRLAWAEIVQVNLRAGDPWVQLDLADGTCLAVMGIQPGIARERAIADARALRALADAHGTGGEPTR
jgi:hypothetical protein